MSKDPEAIQNLTQTELMELKQHFKENIMYVTLFFTDLTITETIETPLITGYNTLANIGGALGLYLGGSLIACCEIFEIILRCVMASFMAPKQIGAVKTHLYK